MKKLLLTSALALCLAVPALGVLANDDPSPFTDPAGLFTATVPAGWTARSEASLVALSAPEGQLTVYLGAFAGMNADEAVTAAWTAAEGAVPTPSRVSPSAARPGIESASTYTYDLIEGHVRLAIAEHVGEQLYVTLVSGNRVDVEKRAAQINVVATGFEPVGRATIDLAGVVPGLLEADELAAFSDYVSTTLELFDVPGAAIAVVQNGEVKLAKGFGSTAREGGRPVTPETLLMIGSTTKSMTTAVMAQLVDEGLMRWDQPAREILPQFAVADPTLSETITVQNLVCACTGAPRRDLEVIFNSAELDAEAVVTSLREFEFFTKFGEAFQYSNQMVATGGWVAASADGARWGNLDEGYLQLMQERLFDPLGLSRTTFDFDTVVADPDHALPHARHGSGKRVAIPVDVEKFVLPVIPAGGVWSTANDMSAYLRMLLADGRWNGAPLVPAEGIKQVTTPQIPVTAQVSYGLGWFVENWNGQSLIYHGGNSTGFSADFAMLPDADAGIAILSNAGGANDFLHAVRTRFLEHLFDLPHSYDKQARIGRESAIAAMTVYADAAVPEATDTLLGKYRSDALGEAWIRTDDERLVLDIGEYAMELRQHPQIADALMIWDGLFLGMPVRPGTSNLVIGEGATAYEFVKLD